MKDISNNELILILDNAKNIKDILYHLMFLVCSYPNFFENHKDFLKKCFKKFNNLYIISPQIFKSDKNFTEAAISVTASNILFIDKKLNFDDLKKFVEINPFVVTYSIEFVSKKEQDYLFLEAFKNTGKSCFFYDIGDESLKEQILLDIYLNDIKLKSKLSDEIIKESEKFISSFSEEDIENIMNLRGKSII